MPLIVLSNNPTPSYILYFYLLYFVPVGTAFVTFCESNAKALSTRSALSKVPLRPAGGFSVLTDGAAFRRLDTAAFRLSPNTATLQCL
jgi:hypothetical protein